MNSSLLRMHCRAVTYLIALAALFSHTVGELSMTPQNIESKVGDTTNFNCSTDLESWEIFWYQGNSYIYTGHGILEPFQGRFEIHENASIGSHSLVIHSVEPGDAGEYVCADDDGFGTRRSAELVVLDNDPDCQTNMQPDGVIGQNIFNIPLDDVHLTCNVTYHGNIPPKIEWKKVGDNRFIRDNVTSNITSNNHLIYTLKLKGDIALDRSSYVCETTRSATNQYKCTSETIKVLYFAARNTREQNAVRGDKVTCTVSNNTFPCIKQWYHDSNYTSPILYDETITTHLLGEYLCTVKCLVRGTDYTFEALKVFVVEATTSLPPSTSGTVAVAVVVSVIVIILVVVAAVLVVHSKKNKARALKAEQMERLLANVAFAGTALRKRTISEYEVAEQELELLYKMKKEAPLHEKAILGVAIVGGRLIIVRENSSKLEIYDCANFTVAPKLLDVKELVAAVDICSCKINDCLYIMDKKNVRTPKGILKFSTDGALLGNWPVKNNAVGYLSTTTEGNVIITVQDIRMLLEYSSDGNLVRDIKLRECINPWHAIKLNDDQYIVSHGTLIDRFNRVCIVDKKGKVENSFGREIGSREDRLNMPFYLAVGSNGCVIVADLRNDRVLLLDSNLEFKTKLVPKYKQRFVNPRRIYLDENFLVVVIAAGDPKKAEEKVGHSRNGTEKDNTSAENNDLLRKAETGRLKEVDDSQKIEQECRLLVFDIQPLLQKYDN